MNSFLPAEERAGRTRITKRSQLPRPCGSCHFPVRGCSVQSLQGEEDKEESVDGNVPENSHSSCFPCRLWELPPSSSSSERMLFNCGASKHDSNRWEVVQLAHGVLGSQEQHQDTLGCPALRRHQPHCKGPLPTCHWRALSGQVIIFRKSDREPGYILFLFFFLRAQFFFCLCFFLLSFLFFFLIFSSVSYS